MFLAIKITKNMLTEFLLTMHKETIMTKIYKEQAGRRLDSAPSANVVAMATKIAHPLVVSPGRPKHIRSIWHTIQLIGDFVKNSPNLPKFRCHGNKGRPATFCMVPLNRPSPKTPSRPKHLWSICHTSRLKVILCKCKFCRVNFGS